MQFLIHLTQKSLNGLIFGFFLLHVYTGLEKGSFITEQPFYINEVLSFYGLLLFIQNWRVFTTQNNLLIKSVIFLVLYGGIYVLYSFLFLKQGSLYEFLRTLPLWYSIFCFFLGCCLWSIYQKFKAMLPTLFSWLLAGSPMLLLSAERSASAYLVLVKNWRAYDPVIIFFTFLLAGDATAKVCFIVYVLFVFLREKFIFFISPIFLIFVSLFGLLFLNQFYDRYETVYYSGRTFPSPTVPGIYEANHGSYGDISNELLEDDNSIWRLLFWAYNWDRNISSDPLWGIGFGTPLFDGAQDTWYLWVVNEKRDPYFPYTLGLHNSFLTVLVRMGFVGFIPLLCIYFWLFSVFNNHPVLLKNRDINALFIAFMLITTVALFNVVLESPRYAAMFWVILGLLYQSILFHYPLQISSSSKGKFFVKHQHIEDQIQ
ncbi:MAG: O-antigen ligase family protein [SAR324 cluster bacterium]|nr:O-antigen ligase family protein [SAR324 cluster bacterium]